MTQPIRNGAPVPAALLRPRPPVDLKVFEEDEELGAIFNALDLGDSEEAAAPRALPSRTRSVNPNALTLNRQEKKEAPPAPRAKSAQEQRKAAAYAKKLFQRKCTQKKRAAQAKASEALQKQQHEAAVHQPLAAPEGREEARTPSPGPEPVIPPGTLSPQQKKSRPPASQESVERTKRARQAVPPIRRKSKNNPLESQQYKKWLHSRRKRLAENKTPIGNE